MARPKSKTKRRKQEIEADLLELKLQRERGEWREAKKVQAAFEEIGIRLRQAIDALDVTLLEKTKIKSELKSVFDDVAKRY